MTMDLNIQLMDKGECNKVKKLPNLKELTIRVWLRLEKKIAHSTKGEVLNTDQA